MTDFEKFLDLVTEYQRAKEGEKVQRSAPMPRPASVVAQEAEDALMAYLAAR